VPGLQEVLDNLANGHETLQIRRFPEIKRSSELARAIPVLRRI
jgi:hypothetical protein